MLTKQPRQLRFLRRADRAPVYTYLSEGTTESPNFHATRDHFETVRQLSDTNTQQDQYQWAGDTLLNYENQYGRSQQARLLYPADYRSEREHPMVVLIYENRSDNLHSYNAPNLARLCNQHVLSSAGFAAG
ncbi:hypothetical protein [Aquisalimonas sp.]|uniref:hypothetical protein n=1 Tax=Aquisalimonas sp. TaxID=1872621 RepID=UPI0025BB52FE|nr:hypothetical protein [Aquisalimonas sp.]